MILSETERLEEWNLQIASRYVANNVLLTIYLIVGIFGNLLVIIIYTLRMHNNIDDRYFIPWLAVLDLFTTVLRSSFELIRKHYPVTLRGTIFCKVVWLLIDIFAFSSIMLLLVIAFHRYLKVCRPFGKQMTLSWKRTSLCVTFIVSFAAAATLNTYNSEIRVVNKELNVTGHTCDLYIDNDMGVGFYILAFMTTALALLVIIGLVVFYIYIGRTIHSQAKARQFRQASIQNASNDRKNACLKVSKRYSYMFMAITVGYCVSYIPQFVILFWEIKDGKFLFDKYEYESALLSLLRETTIINHIINPFIYGLYDKAFRKEVKRTLKCTWHEQQKANI